MEDLRRIIAEHQFFKHLNPEHIQLIVGCAANVVFKEGEFLFREGEDADRFYLIRQGRVLVEAHVPNRGAVVLQSREAGEMIGWSWLVPPYKWAFDVRASETTRAIGFDGRCLRNKCEEDHHLGHEIMKQFAIVISELMNATRIQLLDMYGDHKNP